MTIRTFATNENNDIYLGPDGNLVVLSGIEAVQQLCLNAAKTQLGEMFLYVNQGVPNFQTVWNGIPNLNQFRAALLNTLLTVNGVDRVINLNVEAQNGSLIYSAEILTEYGNAAINGVITNLQLCNLNWNDNT